MRKLCWESSGFVIIVALFRIFCLSLKRKGWGIHQCFTKLLAELSLHPYLEKIWLWGSGRQDSTGSEGLKQRFKGGWNSGVWGKRVPSLHTTAFWPWILKFLLWKSVFLGSTDEFKNQALLCGRRKVTKCANKHFPQCAEVQKINMVIFPYKRFHIC